MTCMKKMSTTRQLNAHRPREAEHIVALVRVYYLGNKTVKRTRKHQGWHTGP